MSKYYIRHMEVAELKDFYARIEKDFASGEYPPLDVLHNHLQTGRQDGFVLCNGTFDLAYSFCAASSDHGCVLISLFAVFQEFRGQGIGSAFLQELHKIYTHKQALIVEVERPEEAATAEEQTERLRRIAFYEKEGYHILQGIDYTVWDIPLHLMALSINASDEIIYQEIEQIMYQIYMGLVGERFINKMRIAVRIDDGGKA